MSERPFGAFERLLAFRYLRARRTEGFVSVITGISFLGIGLGVATLIVVMAVMNGFRHDLVNRILGLNPHVTVRAAEGPITDFEAFAERLRGIPGVVGVAPVVEAQVMVTAPGGGGGGGAVVRGIAPDRLAELPTIARSIVFGSLEDFRGQGIIVGMRMANQFGMALGDRLTLIAAQTRSPEGTAPPPGVVLAPQSRAFPIAAVFQTRMYEYDSGHLYMPLQAAQQWLGLGDAVTHIAVQTADPEAVAPVTAAVRAALGEGYTVIDWTEANSSFFTALQVERNVMFLILTLIILVAAFNIVSGLVMLVKDKGPAVGILRTMGASRGMIMRIFVLTGASTGVVGTLGGLGLGLLLAENMPAVNDFFAMLGSLGIGGGEVRFLASMPARVDYGEVIAVAVMALALSCGATLYPSWRAARLDPVEALRYE